MVPFVPRARRVLGLIELRWVALVLMATDGLWDVVSDEEAMQFALASQQQSQQSAEECCRQLAELARTRGSRDDITVMLVRVRTSAALEFDRSLIGGAVATDAAAMESTPEDGLLGQPLAIDLTPEQNHPSWDVRKQLGF